jgi:hypothetical protein
MKSSTLPVYKTWLAAAAPEQVEFVDTVYAICEEHYEHGGDRVVECFEPEFVLEYFENIKEVQEFCGRAVEQELNCRWGEDSDPEVERYEGFKNRGEW